MSSDWQWMVREFHEKFGLPSQRVPRMPALEERKLRAALILEEAYETVTALLGTDLADEAMGEALAKWDALPQSSPSLTKAVDGFADLLYVTLGGAVDCGVDMEPVMDCVHASNMSKDGGGSREDGKILKGPNFIPPDIEAVLRDQKENPL